MHSHQQFLSPLSGLVLRKPGISLYFFPAHVSLVLLSSQDRATAMHLDWLFVMGETVLGCLAPPLLLALQFAVFFLRIGEDEVQGGRSGP